MNIVSFCFSDGVSKKESEMEGQREKSPAVVWLIGSRHN